MFIIIVMNIYKSFQGKGLRLADYNFGARPLDCYCYFRFVEVGEGDHFKSFQGKGLGFSARDFATTPKVALFISRLRVRSY